MAGYQGTPLPKTLGIKAGHKVCLLNAPGHVERHIYAADDVRIAHDLRLPPVDVVVLFVDKVADLEKRFADIAARLHPSGGFWVAWRKRSDITDDVVRRIALAVGMVDNKAVSIRGGWSGLRLVLRPEIRDAMSYRAAPVLPRRARRVSSHGAPGSAMHRARARSTK